MRKIDHPAEGGSFLQESRLFWEQKYGNPLTQEDVRQIIDNTTRLFELLARWDGEDNHQAESEECDKGGHR